MQASFGLSNYYFNISGNGTDAQTISLNKDFINLSVTEELGKMATGTIELYDPSFIYSAFFPYGSAWSLEWGYKQYDVIAQLANKTFTPSTSFRKGLKSIVTNMSGSGGDKGDRRFSTQFYAQMVNYGSIQQTYNSGTYSSAIQDVASKMNVYPSNMVIDFDNATKALSTKNGIVANGKSFSVLRQWALEWGCTFNCLPDLNDQWHLFFIDSKKYSNHPAVKAFHSAIGINRDAIYLDYGYPVNINKTGNRSNVISYNWKRQIGDSNGGFQFVGINPNGSPIMQHYSADTKQVVQYTLNTDRVRQFLGIKANGEKQASASEMFSQLQTILGSSQFKDVEKFFDKGVAQTVPDGLGYTVSVKMLGDPNVMVGMPVYMENGFPLVLNNDGSNGSAQYGFTVLKATHNISKSGYTTDLEIVDNYTLNGQSYLQIGRGNVL